MKEKEAEGELAEGRGKKLEGLEGENQKSSRLKAKLATDTHRRTLT